MRPNTGRAILGGLVGTLAITFLMYAGGLRMDIAAMLGGWGMGMAMHLLNGTIIFPFIYAYVLFTKLPGSPHLKGLLWGLILWVLAQIVVMPMMGAGLFGLKMGGMMPAFGSLMGHVVYGALLGWIAGHAQAERHERPATA
ncbi:MAG TPA: DUF6789 family protein [Candidatus Acidoferrales bacterium]